MWLYLSGINEANGNERLAALGIMVLQVLRLHVHFRGNYDVLFPRKDRRRPSDHYLWRSNHHIRVSSALRPFSYDLLLCHLNILLERFDYSA